MVTVLGEVVGVCGVGCEVVRVWEMVDVSIVTVFMARWVGGWKWLVRSG